MAQLSAQGTMTVRRLRTGDTLSLMLNSDKKLKQWIQQGGAPYPDWSIASEQPTITPKVVSTLGAAVSISHHQWQYNGITLIFDSSADSDGFAICNNFPQFKLNTKTGVLKIVQNLASNENIANDTLTYLCQATVNGVEYNLTASIDVQIQETGSSSYWGEITASTLELNEDVNSVVVTAQLWLGATQVTDFDTKWYKDDTEWIDNTNKKTLTVTRDDIDNIQLFICKFYEKGGDTPVAVDYITIVDAADEYGVVCSIKSNSASEVNDGVDVTVEAKVIKYLNRATDNWLDVTSSIKNPQWNMQVYDPTTWELIKQNKTNNSIVITTKETDRTDKNGNSYITNVEVYAEVTFSI